jgi:outer membrane protein assembly factor BamD (BamD/ComL family)
MKETLKHLNSQEWFEADDFYAISVYKNQVSLQGVYSAYLISKYAQAEFSFKVNPNSNYIEASKYIDGNSYTIVLT